jgi:hypothetical protein
MVTNLNGDTVPLYSHTWNNHLQHLQDGTGYIFPRPACFVEVLNEVTFEMMGGGYRNADLGIRLHIISDFYNNEGTYEQDDIALDLRDEVLSMMKFYVPTACTPLECRKESQDYDHANVYHYILDYTCNFVDSKTSMYDDQNPLVFEAPANPDLDVTVTPGTPPISTPETQEFIIPQRTY